MNLHNLTLISVHQKETSQRANAQEICRNLFKVDMHIQCRLIYKYIHNRTTTVTELHPSNVRDEMNSD